MFICVLKTILRPVVHPRHISGKVAIGWFSALHIADRNEQEVPGANLTNKQRLAVEKLAGTGDPMLCSQPRTSRIARAKTGSARSTMVSVAVRLILSRPGNCETLPGNTQTFSEASRAAKAASSRTGELGMR